MACTQIAADFIQLFIEQVPDFPAIAIVPVSQCYPYWQRVKAMRIGFASEPCFAYIFRMLELHYPCEYSVAVYQVPHGTLYGSIDSPPTAVQAPPQARTSAQGEPQIEKYVSQKRSHSDRSQISQHPYGGGCPQST